jgi:enoyl-CoA hydratase/carnithine racemase
MAEQAVQVGRRAIMKSAAMMAVAATAHAQAAQGAPQAEPQTSLQDIPLAPANTVTVERRGDIVLVGINRPAIQNRIDPPTRLKLGEVFYQYEHDVTLRAMVLFGHGENFSRGIDVDASQQGIVSGTRVTSTTVALDILGNSSGPKRTKPIVAVVHGDTWNLGHEIYLACDIRVAAADTRFGQDENTHGRFTGGGATVRFVREAGWGNAMRYMLTGDHWDAQESYRMGVTQQVAPSRQAALDAGIVMARKIAGCGPLSIKATLASAHQVIDPVEADALGKLGAQYAALYRTEDFLEGRRAEAENRPPRYQGK